MIKQLRASKRHRRLMNVAEHLVRQAYLDPTDSPERVTPGQVACLAFARYQMRIDDTEAADYLAAALVTRGYHTDHQLAADNDQH